MLAFFLDLINSFLSVLQHNFRPHIISMIHQSTISSHNEKPYVSSTGSTDNDVTAIFVTLFAANAFQQIGIDKEMILLKIISVIMLFLTYILGGKLIFRFSRLINHKKFYFLGLLLSLYPILSITYNVFSNFSLKTFTDGYIIFGSYYFMPLLGCAIVVGLLHCKLDKVQFRIFMFSAPLAAVLCFLGLRSDTPQFYGQIVIDNYFIPLAFLLLVTGWDRLNLVGIFGLFSIGAMAAAIGSRSYMILFICFLVAFLLRFKRTSLSWVVLPTSLVFISLGIVVVYKASQSDSIVAFGKGYSIYDKFSVGTLSEAIDEAIKKRDLFELYYWEGNSRADIIKQAFNDFNISQKIFGGGPFATYEVKMGSVTIQRSTIEIGWLQEIFRWGYLHVLLVLGVSIYSLIQSFNRRLVIGDLAFGLIAILAIRVTDSWIYGLATNSVYALLFHSAIMINAINVVPFKYNSR